MRETRLAMIMAAALAISGVETTKAAAPAISRVATTNTSWWRLALAAPAIAPDFALLSKRVCKRKSTFIGKNMRPYFPTDCASLSGAPPSGGDGLGHVGMITLRMIGKGNGPGPGPHYFQDVISEAAVFLRDVDGLGDGFAPSLYCHERDWLHAGKQRVTGEEIAGVQIAARWRTGDAVFRDHFECFVAPPLDEWFGFDALPPADDPAWERRAVAEAYAAVDHDAFVDCGAADGELRVVVHVRLGDLIHPDLSVNASATALASISMRSQGGHLRNALRVVAELRALPGAASTLILSDSPPETVAASLEGLDVGIRVGGARGDGASHLVDGRTAGLETDFDVSFHGAGNPLVALHCMAAADLLLWPEECGNSWKRKIKRKKQQTKKTGRLVRRLRDGEHAEPFVTGSGPTATLKRCSKMVLFARKLALRGVPRGLPVKPLDATAVDAGVEELLELLGGGFPWSRSTRRPSTPASTRSSAAARERRSRRREWAEKTGFEARVAADYALWRNASARVRRDVRPLERELAEYRRLVRAVADPCAADPRNFEEDQCLWRDNGCAQPCIDAGLARDAG
ncbi:hypothetical protein JL722_6801 [Aureococcus anophagefferens]|nr:hypothetical protein JL722_6801 [Aureococcus anophagefferens]